MIDLPQFPHRHNVDGTYDSICVRCFVTIAHVSIEAELTEFEASHTCDPIHLYRVSQSYSAPPSFS